jgi:hypothetical protein
VNSSSEPRVPPPPSAYREQNPYKPPPPDYKPPSMLAEHKGLAILFAAILIGFAGYGWKVLHAPARHAAPLVDHGPAPAASPAPATPGSNESASPAAASSAQPIYIEAVPDKEPR